MAWINITSEKFRLNRLVREGIRYFDEQPGFELTSYKVPLYALMCGDLDLFQCSLNHCRSWLEYCKAQSDQELAENGYILESAIGNACIMHLAGEPQDIFFRRLSAIKMVSRIPEQMSAEAMVKLLAQLVFEEPITKVSAKVKTGHYNTEQEWIKAMDNLPLSHLFQLANCPDHVLWNHLEPFILPLALLLKKQNKELDLFELLNRGIYADRHGEVFYERRSAKPAFQVIFDNENPSTWRGFDAIEVYRKELLIYHYLGFQWQSPLCFKEERMNAFAFLKQLDCSWRLVEMQLEPARWERLRHLREELPCVHVIVHDSSVSPYLPEHMEKAAIYYAYRYTLMTFEARITEGG